MGMMSLEVSICFAFCPSVSLCGTNWGQIFRLPKSSWTMVWAVTLLIFLQSILAWVADLVPASVPLYRLSPWLCLSMFDPNVAHPQSFRSLRESVWTIRKHIFYSWLPSRPPAPTFHACPLQISPICSRSWSLYVAPLRCDTTSHTDYVQLAEVGFHCMSRADHAVSILPMSLKYHVHVRTHARSCRWDMTPFTVLFRQPCVLSFCFQHVHKYIYLIFYTCVKFVFK